MASINVNDYLTGAKAVPLDGKYLIAKTRDDGFTGTWAGNYIYKVQKSGNNYYVIEQKWDFDKLAWVDKDAPIIRYDGTTLFLLLIRISIHIMGVSATIKQLLRIR